mmetsp:Transcript_49339/g.132031  ORF Transcript_49339/g.132031 Transcript_49339/m.132031 type:complete len:231 (-) Transcript_49339:187-879(-)
MAASDVLVLDLDVLVQGKPQLRIPHQVRLHLDAAINGAVHHEPVRAHQHRDALEDVHEDLVLLLAARGLVLRGPDRPVHRVAGHRPGVPLRQVESWLGLLDHDCLVVDARLQVLSVCRLRVPEVHHLVEELIDQDEVLPDALLVQHPAEVLEDLCHLAQQLYDRRGRDIHAGGGDEIQPVLLDEDVADAVQVEDRRGITMPELHLAEEYLRSPLDYIAPEVSGDDGVSSQ